MATKGNLYPLETAFFGISPVEFIDDIYNIVDDYISDGTDALEKAFEKELKHEPQLQKKLREDCDRFVLTVRGIFDKNFDKFEMYLLRNIFRLPDSVVSGNSGAFPSESTTPTQPAAAPLITMDSNVNESELDSELEELSKRLEAAYSESRQLAAEKAVLQRNLDRFEKGVDKLNQSRAIWESLSGNLESTLTESAQHAKALRKALHQMEALRQRLEEEEAQRTSIAQSSTKTFSDELEELFAGYQERKKAMANVSVETARSWLQNFSRYPSGA